MIDQSWKGDYIAAGTLALVGINIFQDSEDEKKDTFVKYLLVKRT